MATLLGLLSACASGGRTIDGGADAAPDATLPDAGDGGVLDAADGGEDASMDTSVGDASSDTSVGDTGVPDGGGGASYEIYFMSGGGGAASSSTRRLLMSVGAPQPMGEAANASYRLRVGPSAAHP
jgi:hypothetical protein